MIVPNKAVSYEQSLLSKLPIVLQTLSVGQMSVVELYQKTQQHFADLSEFLLAVDMLYILEKVELTSGEIKNAD